jgi:predicted nucleic acid-binding protein
MPTVDLVVSDTSPLLNLALIGRLDLVERQFETVMAPERV